MEIFLIVFALGSILFCLLFVSKEEPSTKTTWTPAKEAEYQQQQLRKQAKLDEQVKQLKDHLKTGFKRAITDLEARYIFIDFETTDLPIDNRVPGKDSLAYYPHVVQAAMLIFNDKFELIDEFASVIKVPEGVHFAPAATKVHKITKERCRDEGRDISCFFDILKMHLSPTVCVVAHNIQFDNQLLRIEAKRFGYRLPKYQTFCTMKSTKDDVAIFKYNSYSYKLPKLKELVAHAFLDGQKTDVNFGFHDAYTDISLCALSFFKMNLQERVPELEVED